MTLLFLTSMATHAIKHCHSTLRMYRKHMVTTDSCLSHQAQSTTPTEVHRQTNKQPLFIKNYYKSNLRIMCSNKSLNKLLSPQHAH